MDTTSVRTTVSAEVPDWSRERPVRWWDPSRRLLRSVRRWQAWKERKGWIAKLMLRRWLLSHRFWSIITGADIPLNSHLGGGLLTPHPNGIVVHPDAVIGPNCLLFQQVTIGGNGSHPGLPILEGHVDVGAGAKLLGNIRIGKHAKIGANAVVLCDVPSHATAVGVPARILERKRPIAPS